MLASMISQQGIHTVDAILHRRIGAGYPEGDIKQVAVAGEEVFDDLPVGARGRGSALLGRGVPIDIYFQWQSSPPLLRATQELFAGGQRVGVWLDHFF